MIFFKKRMDNTYPLVRTEMLEEPIPVASPSPEQVREDFERFNRTGALPVSHSATSVTSMQSPQTGPVRSPHKSSLLMNRELRAAAAASKTPPAPVDSSFPVKPKRPF